MVFHGLVVLSGVWADLPGFVGQFVPDDLGHVLDVGKDAFPVDLPGEVLMLSIPCTSPSGTGCKVFARPIRPIWIISVHCMLLLACSAAAWPYAHHSMCDSDQHGSTAVLSNTAQNDYNQEAFLDTRP